MMNNSTSKMIMLMLTLSTLISLNSNNWMTMWMTIEMNMFMFIPLMTKKKMKDQPIKYLIIQSVSSSMLILSIIWSLMNEFNLNQSVFLMLSLSMKLGLSPFHIWLPQIMSKLSWNKCFVLITIMKISPMMISSQMTKIKLMLLPMILSLITGSIGGMKQTSIKKMLAYSSISNSAWMLSSFMMSKMIALTFMSIYSLMNFFLIKTLKKMSLMFINQISSFKSKENFNMNLIMLSLSGLPPLIGFFPKWMILKEMLHSSTLLSMIMIITSMMSMYFYIQMTSNSLLSFSMKKKNMKKNKTFSATSMNLMGLSLIFLIKSI